MVTEDQLSLTFAALAHPVRRAMLARLSAGETSVQELSKPFHLSPPAVSKHLKVLERSGLITRGREAQWRPCRLAPLPIKDAADWIEQYRAQWEAQLDRLGAYLHDIQSAQQGDSHTKGSGEKA
ncbi:MAG: metalloregulator ArsR/SmtB family transcription factor [Vicinamibacterales bacterium]